MSLRFFNCDLHPRIFRILFSFLMFPVNFVFEYMLLDVSICFNYYFPSLCSVISFPFLILLLDICEAFHWYPSTFSRMFKHIFNFLSLSFLCQVLFTLFPFVIYSPSMRTTALRFNFTLPLLLVMNLMRDKLCKRRILLYPAVLLEGVINEDKWQG